MKVKQEKTENKELRDRVERHLEWEPELNATDIGVAADHGIVTLTGSVKCESQKLAAERAAKRTFGVKGVANDITVSPNRDDRFRYCCDGGRALSSGNVPGKDIIVIVKDKNIYLDRRVEWKFEKEAGKAVKHIGAKGVINNKK
jgi:hypothetical protein